MIFDTHAHYDDEAFSEDREELIGKLNENGIRYVVNIGTCRETCVQTLRLTEKYPFFFGAIGFHPSDIAGFNENEERWFREQAKNEKIIAIGEIGLDYYWDKEEEVQEKQREAFVSQLKLARQLKLPVAVHSREAAKDTMDIIKEHGQGLGGVIHCYSYHVQDALAYVEMGYYIGVGGVLTFKNARKLREVVEAVPIERIVLETDCPYLAPEPYRGKRNSSLYLPYVVEKLAEIKGLTPSEVEDITFKNAVDMYRISHVMNPVNAISG
ncbi:MAG: TatD family hydrolase [Lachnospiraceae bacterium]|nr:TatD family hydrolase [Lachnospiraceae bacterium]